MHDRSERRRQRDGGDRAHAPSAAAASRGVLICGGGSPKNFMLQTEPQIQEVLGIDEKGHDFFLQITDARPDTGGLSGATPAEAVSWGKIDPDRLPDAVVCYLDSTVALPLLTAYAHARHKKRPLKRLYDRRGEMMKLLRTEFEKAGEGSRQDVEICTDCERRDRDLHRSRLADVETRPCATARHADSRRRVFAARRPR